MSMEDYILVRISSEEKEALRHTAKRLGMTISSFIRLLTFEIAKTVPSGTKGEVAESFSHTVSAIISRMETKPVTFKVEGDKVKYEWKEIED